MINAQSTCPASRLFWGYTKVRIHGKKTHYFSGRKKSHGSPDLFVSRPMMKVVFFLWQYMMVDDESRKWQVWHDFVKRGSYLEKENTHTARQQNSSYLDLHQQWPPNNKKWKEKMTPIRLAMHEPPTKKTQKKFLDVSHAASCLILWMDEVLWRACSLGNPTWNGGLWRFIPNSYLKMQQLR